MTSDLFPDCRQDSPRLAWMKRHGIHTSCFEDADPEPWSAWQGDSSCIAEHGKDPFFGYLTGTTELNAIVNLAESRCIPLWNEEEYINGKEAE